MPLPTVKDDLDHRILEAIASGQRVTQRSLADELGVALGLANLLIRRLIAKGWVRMVGVGPRHVRYLMTAAGIDALGRATRLSLENTVHLYTKTREQIRSSLDVISARCTPDASGCKRVVFYGAGDVAEIAYVSMQRTDLSLSGVVDDKRQGQFFGMPIRRPEQLSALGIDGVPYAHVVVTSVKHAGSILARLDALGVPRDRISCL